MPMSLISKHLHSGEKMKIVLPMIAFVLALSVSAAPPRKIPIREFFQNPPRCFYLLSPDGEKISFLAPWHGHLNIFVESLASGAIKQLTSETENDIEPQVPDYAQFGHSGRLTSEQENDVPDYFWKGNDSIIYTRDDKGDQNFHIYRVDVAKAQSEDLTPFPSVCAEVIADLAGNSKTDILIKLNRRDPQIFDVARLNTVTKTIDVVWENNENAQHWLVDHSGRLRAAVANIGTETCLLTRPDDHSPFRTVRKTDFRESISPQCYTPDDRALYAISNVGRDKAALVKIDPETGAELKVIYQNDQVDVAGVESSRKRKIVTCATYATSRMHRKFFDVRTEALFRALRRKLPGRDFWIAAQDEAEKKMIVVAASDRNPGAEYLLNRRIGGLKKLVELAPSLKEEELAPMLPICFPSGDGWTIHGYLTLPVGSPSQNLPAVVRPHGGPWQRDGWGYDPEAQFLANRGYAVLQMDFRGSLGYGCAFWEAGFKQWGRKMQGDVTAGVNWLISQRIADPKRIAIYGESYGGYAALAGIAFTPDLYAAAVDRAGISNLTNYLDKIPPYWRPLLPMIYAKVGDPVTDREMLKACSPLLSVDRIKASLFVAHGANDPRVNKSQSDQVVGALRGRGATVEYLEQSDIGHTIDNETDRIAFYQAVENFLERNLKPDRK